MKKHVVLGRLVVAMAVALFAHFAWGADGASVPYQEKYRPQLHFSPPAHWMNDPNGMVYHDGHYHLFYQYHPFGSTWGPMHWGHAVSTDLVHWQNLPIALAPDSNGMIFSGSVVFDSSNSSGLGSAAHPPLVAIYTQHDADQMKAGSNTFQTQSIAYSLDDGRTWTKYAHNPVLPNPGFKDFRDPRVSWFAATRRWVMTLAVGDHVAFYSSADLIHWAHETDFGVGWGAHGGVWECPDLFPLRVEGESTQKYVLLVSINPGGPNGGSATQYFVGDFDGHGFVPETDTGASQEGGGGASSWRTLWLDEGTDNYAGGTWSGIPGQDGRRIFIGWMSNWLYGEAVPTEPWRSALTLPRQLTLVRGAQQFELRTSPVRELESLRSSAVAIGRLHGKGDFVLVPRRQGKGTFVRVPQQQGKSAVVPGPLQPGGEGLELLLNIDAAEAGLVTLDMANELGQQVQLRINRRLQRYELDRSKSGDVGFNPEFAHDQYAALKTTGRALSLHIFIDSASIEIFADEGRTVMTAIAFPSFPFNTVTLSADQPIEVNSGTAYRLRSIWTDREPSH